MAAPIGNQFWKARSKHGRDRVVSDPQTLASAADEYFQWCIDNPIIQKDYKGQEAKKVDIEHPRVFKKEEFARFCGLAQWRSVDELKAISKDFSQIVSQVEGIIADQKYTYAVVGMFNASIIARDLGLKEQQEMDLTTGGKPFSLNIKPDTE